MSRGVSTPRGAIAVVYTTFEPTTDDDSPDEWDCFLENIEEDISKRFPSFFQFEHWVSNEDHALLRNDKLEIGVSEYCGVVAIWALPCNVMLDQDSLKWRRLRDYALRILSPFARMRKVGTFSNGESVYEAVKHD